MNSKTFTNPKSDSIRKFIESALADCQKKASARTVSVSEVEIPKIKGEGLYSIDGGAVLNSYKYSAETTAVSIAWWTSFEGKKIVRVCVARTWAKKGACGNAPTINLCQSGWAGVYPDRARQLAQLQQERKAKLVTKYSDSGYYGVKEIAAHAPNLGLIVKACNGVMVMAGGLSKSIPAKFADKKSKFCQQRSAAELVQSAIELV
jgi:hypothetical protein